MIEAATATRTVAVPGATIACWVLGDLAGSTADNPPLLVLGSPMDHTGFGTLAGHLPDRVVVLLDPRNTGASRVDEPGAPVTPDQHAADLHAVVADLGVGPVDMFATSGGAVNALHRASLRYWHVSDERWDALVR